MTALILTVLLVQAKTFEASQLVESVTICQQEHNIKRMLKDIKQAHANAKLSGAIDLGRVNDNAEGIEAAREQIAEMKKAIVSGRKPLPCNHPMVTYLQRCVNKSGDQGDLRHAGCAAWGAAENQPDYCRDNPSSTPDGCEKFAPVVDDIQQIEAQFSWE